MDSESCPSFIGTEEARQFWQNKHIKNLDTLRTQSASFTYVAIDCEGQEGYGDGVTSVGLAFLPSTHPLPMSVFELWPWRGVNLDDAVLHYQIKSVSLRVEERRRGRVAEPFRYGKVDSIPLHDLENHICQHLQAVQQQKRLVLVAWSIENEMRAMIRLFPALLSRLDWWIDLADITSYMSGIRTKQKRSLRDTLLTFGFTNGYSVQDFRYPHDPGMDVTRTAAALAALVACPTRQIDIPKWTFEEKAIRKQLQKRPSRDKHPYAVRISTRDGSPMPQTINSPLKLENFVKARFATPSAVAVCPPSKPERQKTHGWICFDDLSVMESFMQQLNGCETDGVSLHLYIDGPLESK